MARQVTKKILREIVAANPDACTLATITDALGEMEDVLANSHITKGYLEQMVEKGQLSLAKGNYSIPVKAPGGASVTTLYKVDQAKDGSLSMAETAYNADQDGTDGWRRTPLAAIKVFKAEAYQVWLDVLGPIRELEAQHRSVKEEKEAA